MNLHRYGCGPADCSVHWALFQ